MKKAYIVPIDIHPSVEQYDKFMGILIQKGIIRRGMVQSDVGLCEVYCTTHIEGFIVRDESKLRRKYDLQYVYKYEEVE